MEVRVIARVPEGQPRPRSVPMHLLSDNEIWADAPELGVLGAVVDQDMTNMELTHEGLKVSKNGNVELGDCQEIRIRHFHNLLSHYING